MFGNFRQTYQRASKLVEMWNTYLPATVKFNVPISGSFKSELSPFLQIQEELQIEGFEKESEEMRKEINQLKQEIQETENFWPSIFAELFCMAAGVLLGPSMFQ